MPFPETNGAVAVVLVTRPGRSYTNMGIRAMKPRVASKATIEMMRKVICPSASRRLPASGPFEASRRIKAPTIISNDFPKVMIKSDDQRQDARYKKEKTAN